MNNFLYGFMLSASMIMAIGAQNIHVIRQGLVKKHIFSVAMTCFICDFLLMSIGVFFVGSLSNISPLFHQIITWLAIVFLMIYGLLAFRRAWQSSDSLFSNMTDASFQQGKWRAIVTTLAMSLLNPHVYLDTIVVVGGFASSLMFTDKIRFVSGALCASFFWFFGLAYATPYLLSYLKTPRSAAYFDYFVAAVMVLLAVQLLYGLRINT